MILLSSKSALFLLSSAAILGAALIAGRSTGKHIEINIVSPEILIPKALSKIVAFFIFQYRLQQGLSSRRWQLLRVPTTRGGTYRRASVHLGLGDSR